MKIILYIICSVLLTSCVTSCMTSKNLPKHNNKFKEEAAKYADTAFPCVTIDSQVQETFDSTLYILTIDELMQSVKALNEIQDSLLNVLKADTNCNHYALSIQYLQMENRRLQKQIENIKPVIKYQTITKTVEDSAKNYIRQAAFNREKQVLQKELFMSHEQNEKLNATITTLEGKLKTRTKRMWMFFWIALGLAIWTVRKPLLSLINPIKKFYPF